MNQDELIALMLDALEEAATQLDQISGLMEDEDVEFFDAQESVNEALRIARQLKENQ